MPRPLGWLKGSRKVALLAGVLVIALGAGTGVVLADPGHWFSNDNDWPYNNPGPAPVLASVGDISCQPTAPIGTEKQTDVCAQAGAAGTLPNGDSNTTRNAAQNATAMQIEAMHPALVAVLGDEQYQNGLYTDFENSFDKYWGAFKMLQRPSPGNHEFYDNHGQNGVRGYGYFDYYNGITHNASDGTEVDQTITSSTGGTTVQPQPQNQGQAGDFTQTGVSGSGDGWYSYNLGDWHLISLNIECKYEPGGCSATGDWMAAQLKWLEQDLDQNNKPCVAAYWHQPTFSSTAATWNQDSTEGETADAFWKVLYAHHATLVLNGHDHVYTRFAPMDPAGNADPTHGIREFIIGTGGEALDTLNPSAPNVQASADQWYGVAKFTLGDGWYKWDYQSALEDPAFISASSPATSYSDTGVGLCNTAHGIPGGGHNS